jgi:hypothetical protein
MPSVDKIVDLYEEDDVNGALILESIGAEDIEENTTTDDDDVVSGDDLDKALNEENSDDDDDNWLNDL